MSLNSLLFFKVLCFFLLLCVGERRGRRKKQVPAERGGEDRCGLTCAGGDGDWGAVKTMSY